ncbi:MAG: HAMP domain-containing protein [Anaerolineales bacterium]|nr:HAMP domain-containing protein [Anaerolineales bacterium]
MMLHKRPSQLPLRWRLTLWYLLTLGIILISFATFLYFQLRANLFDQLDASLQLVASQIAISVEKTDQQLAFISENRSAETDFTIFLTAVDGTVWDKTGRNLNTRPPDAPQPGLKTLLIGDDRWRVLSQEVSVDDMSGYLEIVGDMDPISDTLDRLLTLMLIGGPAALVLAGLGGVFLASRALKPIDHMTQTAQAISAGDLHQRIQHEGPSDELGRLAQTFDTMLDRLQTAFERERRFTGDAAHELRTPLTALKGRIGVTLSRTRLPGEYQETLQEMEEQVDRLIRLSSDLLFMARLDQGQFRPHFEQIELNEFMAAVVDQIRPLAAAKSISLDTAVSTQLTLQGDMDLLIRLFLNLLDNGVKYTPENGRVTLHAAAKANSVQITISDTGPGIAAEHLPHLFERFYRVEGDRARKPDHDRHGGAGLGLAIAHEIARFHGGTMTVQSEPGKGTTFVVQLPSKHHS